MRLLSGCIDVRQWTVARKRWKTGKLFQFRSWNVMSCSSNKKKELKSWRCSIINHQSCLFSSNWRVEGIWYIISNIECIMRMHCTSSQSQRKRDSSAAAETHSSAFVLRSSISLDCLINVLSTRFWLKKREGNLKSADCARNRNRRKNL